MEIIVRKPEFLLATLAGLALSAQGFGTLSVYSSVRTRGHESWFAPVRGVLDSRCHSVIRTDRIEDRSMIGYAATDTDYRLFDACPGDDAEHVCAERGPKRLTA